MQRSPDGQVLALSRILELTAFEAVRRDQLDVSEAMRLCRCTRVKDNDSKRSIAFPPEALFKDSG